jgi:hypothetical protein
MIRAFTTINSTTPTFDPGCFIYRRLSSSQKVDAVSVQVGVELARQATLAKPWLNSLNYTARLTEVPADQPLVPVKLMRGDWGGVVPSWAVTLSQALAGGVPIPAGFEPNAGTDHEACFYQPGYVGPTGYRGRYYELWTLAHNTGPDVAQFPWIAGWGGKVIGTCFFPGAFMDWYYDQPQSWWLHAGYKSATPGHPDSTYQDHGWGTTATSLPLRDLEITVNDLASGQIDHVIGLAVIYSGWPHRAPAQRSDSNQPSNVVREGMRLFLPYDYVIPAGLHPVCRAIMQCAKDYGFVIWDQAGCLGFRVEPGGEKSWSGTQTYDVLRGFPWTDLKVIA